MKNFINHLIFNLKKNIFYIFFLVFFLSNFCQSSEYNEIIDKVFANKKIDSIEGIWIKTYANQGPPGCVTIFYKEQEEFFQMHIDNCFVMGKLTGKQKKLSKLNYKGENAIYFYDGKIIWEPSKIQISEDLNSFSITHGINNNQFNENWKRIWPENFQSYNNSIK